MKGHEFRSIALPALGAVAFATTGAAGHAAAQGSASLDEAVRAALSESTCQAVWQVGTPFEGVDAAWQAPNRPQELRTYFLADGPRVVPRSGAADWSLSARLAKIARGESSASAGAAELAVDGRRAEYRREGLVVWYVNDERGIEQGFDLARRPLAGGGDAPLELVIELDGDLRLDRVGETAVTLTSVLDAGPVLSMSGLYAFDALGRDLDARFERRGERLAIVVDDRAATASAPRSR